MKHIRGAAVVSFILAVVIGGCSSDDDSGDHGDEHVGGEHGGEYGNSEEGEELGRRLDPSETHDEVRGGVRLILAYDGESNSFNGTVENVTENVLERVRVEVHLSNGTELGPTTPIDLDPGEVADIRLPATDTPFDWWSAHAEVGSGEHGGG